MLWKYFLYFARDAQWLELMSSVVTEAMPDAFPNLPLLNTTKILEDNQASCLDDL